MPFDGNKWNTKKFLPYQEMLSTIQMKWPNLQRHTDTLNDTAKVHIYSTCIYIDSLIALIYNEDLFTMF